MTFSSLSFKKWLRKEGFVFTFNLLIHVHRNDFHTFFMLVGMKITPES